MDFEFSFVVGGVCLVLGFVLGAFCVIWFDDYKAGGGDND